MCGKVLGFKVLGFNNGEAFSRYITEGGATIEDSYMSGISLTHGPMGNRSHIWSFAAAYSEDNGTQTRSICPCTNTNATWPHQTPSFVGRDYFCDTINRYVPFQNGTQLDVNMLDQLWDGEGCGPTSSCCTFNNPPYFCKKLDHATSDDLEMRLMDQTAVAAIEIYVK